MKVTEWLNFSKGISARVSFADVASGIFQPPSPDWAIR